MRNAVRSVIEEGEKGGYILRTMAEAVTEEELKNDIRYLRKAWSVTQERVHRLLVASRAILRACRSALESRDDDAFMAERCFDIIASASAPFTRTAAGVLASACWNAAIRPSET